MSTLIENVEKVTAAHAAIKEAIAAKGVDVPDGTKLSGMPLLIEKIETRPVPTNTRAVFAYDNAERIVVPTELVVDMVSAMSFAYCFYNCKSLTSLTLPDGFGQNATDVQSCFYNCESLASLTLPDGFGQNATDIHYCFYGCTSLKSLTLPDGFGQNATDIRYCFQRCTSLKSLTLPDGFGQNETDISYCFSNCRSLTLLTLPDGFGQYATNLTQLFNYCELLTSLTLPDGLGQNATIVQACFYNCSSLTSLTLPDGFGQNATNISDCFRRCSSLTSLTLPDGFGQNATQGAGTCFYDCPSLTNIKGNPNFKVSTYFYSSKLTHDSLMVVINGLQTVTTKQTLTLGTTNLAKLTDEEKKVATDKGWTLA